MNYEGNLVQGLVDELLAMIYKYSDAMMVATAIGCLEIVKTQLLEDHLEELEDEDEKDDE